MPHHANRGMASVNQVFSLLDDEEDTPDIKDVPLLTSACPPYQMPGGYAVSTPRSMQRSHGEHQPKRQRMMEPGDLTGHVGKNSSSSSTPGSSCLALKQRDVSEYNYAQALLKQAAKLSNSQDLDRYSVIRLAQAYITLQHGLQSWEKSGSQAKWWPPNIDGGKLALAAQETMSCFVLIITSKGNVVYVSDAVEVLLGHNQLNLVGRSIETLVPPEEMPVLADQFSSSTGASARGTGTERSFYTRMLNVRRSGLHHQRFELVHAVGHLQEVMLGSNASNSPAGQRETWLMCACRVLTPHLENEGSGSPCTEWVSHNALDGVIIYMDARYCQVSGYLPNEVVGLSPYCFIHQDDQEYVAFSHNQALINVGGSSCTYRMYTHSQDIVYVHSTIQLARDKHTNKPKFLFCLHHLVDEQEWREQVSRHQQELMWVKTDPSVKYSMTDIEKAVKALEVDGGNSPLVMSRGGMKTSVLSDSCAADGGDLLSLNLNSHLCVPVPVVPKLEPGLATSSPLCLHQGTQNFYTSAAASQYQQTPSQIQLPASISDSGTGYGGNYGYDNTGRPMQQQQQQPVYSRQLSQQQIYSGIHQQYQQQMSQVGSGSGCSTGLASGSDSPGSANNTGSFVDYLFDTSGPPSVASDGQVMYSPDMVINQTMVSPTGRGRGRSRTRGRPRGSGRGGRGATRGVRGTRGGRGRGSRGRGRANMLTQMSQSHEIVGGMRKSESMMSQNSLSPISIHGSMSPRNSLSPMASGGEHLFMSPDSGIGLQRSSSGGNLGRQQMTSARLGMDIQQMSSEAEGPNHFQPGSIAGDLQRMRSDDMFQQMSSLDGMDILDPSLEFSMHQAPNMEMMSPRSWGVQDRAQMSPYRAVSGSEHVPPKRVGRPRGSKNHLERQQHFQRTMSIDDPSVSNFLGFGAGRDSPFHGQSPSSTSFAGEGSRGTSSNNGGLSYLGQDLQINSISGSSIRGYDGFQRSFSFQNEASGRMAADTDPEHSILGNLLKGRGGSASSAGSKSPAQPVLTNMGRSPGLCNGPDRSGKSPLAQQTMCDRGARSPAHSLISDAASPVSVFSPDSSRTTPTVIKDEPEMMSSMEDPSCAPSVYSSSPGHSKQQHDDILNFVLEQGDHKMAPEMHIFSTQLRQKHRSLEQSLSSQDSVLRQLESTIQQTPKDPSAEAICAKLNFMKANKASQEQELRVIKAKLDAQVHQHQQQLQHRTSQQHQQQQHQQQQQQQQHLGLQRHRLNSPATASTRRMAIVPPIQRQTTEGDMNPSLSQPSPGDLKGSQSGGVLQQNSPDVCAKQQTAPSTVPTENIVQANPALLISGKSQSSRQETPVGADGSFTPSQTPGQLPQPSPFSLHHHHHHHHHYHHHALPQPHVAFPGALKETPPPPYGSYDGSVFSSSAAAASGSVAPAALSISVSSTTNSLASPIICDTSPVSVDESPSCASDASSGYHSLTHSTDALTNLCVGPFNKPHCLDMASTSSGPTFGTKTPPGYEQSLKGAGNPRDIIQSSAHVGNNSPSA